MPLNKLGPNIVRVHILDEKGQPRSESAADLSIIRTGASADGMPITHAIAVKVVSGSSGAEKNILTTLIRKGTSLPASGMEHFKAARDLRANDGRFLEFELFEQADGVDDPAVSLPIGVFRIQSSDLERGDIIRKGDPILVHWKVDGNGLLRCEVECSAISKRYDTDRMYVPTRDHKNFDGEDGLKLAQEALSAAREDIQKADKALGNRVATELEAIRLRIDRVEKALGLTQDADARRAATEEARTVRQELARICNRPENRCSSLRADIDDYMEAVGVSLAPILDQKTNAQIHRLAASARDALSTNDQYRIDDARRSYEEARAVVFYELLKHPAFWISMFEGYANDRHRAIDKGKHDVLATEGEEFIRNNNIDGLRATCAQMGENLIKSPSHSHPEVLAGLMR